MSGHSKWSTIKRKKGAADAKRGKIFTRCIHEIPVAVREGGGGDPDANARLRFALDKARSANMPNETIERAIKRATGEIKGEEQVELSYEGYGPGGVAVFVEVLTGNKNRTVGEVRHAFTRAGGTLGENGCVGWMFEKKGLLVIRRDQINEDDLMELALEAGADDVVGEDDVWEVTCRASEFLRVKEALEAKMPLELAEIQMLPQTRVEVSGKEADQMMRLMETLEDLDDVLNVWTNCDFVEAEK